MTTKQRKPLFDRLRQGLEEGIAHEKGDVDLRTIAVPDEPPEIDSATLIALREQAAMSQAVFAKLLSVSTKTLQSWEQGVHQPSDASRRLLQVFIEQPEVLCRIVGLPEIHLTGVRTEVAVNGRRKVVIRESVRKRRASSSNAVQPVSPELTP